MLEVARYLRDRGHSIIFNTAEVFRRQIEAANLSFVPLSGFANFDYRHLDEAFPERKNFRPGPDQLVYDFKNCFGKPIPDQYWGIKQIMDEAEIALILTDVTFMGTFLCCLDRERAVLRSLAAEFRQYFSAALIRPHSRFPIPGRRHALGMYTTISVFRRCFAPYRLHESGLK